MIFQHGLYVMNSDVFPFTVEEHEFSEQDSNQLEVCDLTYVEMNKNKLVQFGNPDYPCLCCLELQAVILDR